MQPEDAVKQLQYVINAELDRPGAPTAAMYGPTVRRVADEGTGGDVTDLASRLCTDIQAGACPEPTAAADYATRILERRQALTDGGQQ